MTRARRQTYDNARVRIQRTVGVEQRRSRRTPKLPAGRYLVEPIDEEAPELSPEEEAGIEAALESSRQGRVVDAKRAREIIDAALGH